MTAILKVYDKVTAHAGVSLGITIASTALSLYTAYGYKSYIDPCVFLVSACAGSAIAILANIFLLHNNEVRNKGERNNIYSALSLTVGFVSLRDSFLFSNISAIVLHAFAFFGRYPAPGNFIHAPAVGFLLTQLWFQINECRRSD